LQLLEIIPCSYNHYQNVIASFPMNNFHPFQQSLSAPVLTRYVS
jgi:hypothetical protein